MNQNQPHRAKPLWETCAELILEISPKKKKWYRDDMTIAVIEV